MDPKGNGALDSGQSKTILEHGVGPNLPGRRNEIPWWLKSVSRGTLVGLFSGCFVIGWGFLVFVASAPHSWPNVPWSPSESLILPGILVPGLSFGLLMFSILKPIATNRHSRLILVLSGILAALVAFLIIWPPAESRPEPSGFALAGLASGILLMLGVIAVCKPARRNLMWMFAMVASGLCGGIGFWFFLVVTPCAGFFLSYACGHAMTAMPLGWLRWKATVGYVTDLPGKV